MNKITQAFIFAAGRGSRMKPLTDSIPKPLVKINGKAIIDYTIEKLDKIDSIEKIIINGFYLADELKNHLKNLKNPKIIFSHENEKLETGGGLVYASDKIDLNKALLTINGDILWLDNGDIASLCKAWNPEESDILLGLKKLEDYIGYDGKLGDFNLNGDGNLQKSSTEKMSHAYVGLQIINPKILKKAPQKCFSMSHFYKSAITKNGQVKKIKGLELPGKYFHIGTVAAIKNTERQL